MAWKANDTLTPMVRQYARIKAQHPDMILMFRLGDFYEMFNEDARTVADTTVREGSWLQKPTGDLVSNELLVVPSCKGAPDEIEVLIP